MSLQLLHILESMSLQVLHTGEYMQLQLLQTGEYVTTTDRIQIPWPRISI